MAIMSCQRCGRLIDEGAGDVPVHLVPPGAEERMRRPGGRRHLFSYTMCRACYAVTNPEAASAEAPQPNRDLTGVPDLWPGRRAERQNLKMDESE